MQIIGQPKHSVLGLVSTMVGLQKLWPLLGHPKEQLFLILHLVYLTAWPPSEQYTDKCSNHCRYNLQAPALTVPQRLCLGTEEFYWSYGPPSSLPLDVWYMYMYHVCQHHDCEINKCFLYMSELFFFYVTNFHSLVCPPSFIIQGFTPKRSKEPI